MQQEEKEERRHHDEGMKASNKKIKKYQINQRTRVDLSLEKRSAPFPFQL